MTQIVLCAHFIAEQANNRVRLNTCNGHAIACQHWFFFQFLFTSVFMPSFHFISFYLVSLRVFMLDINPFGRYLFTLTSTSVKTVTSRDYQTTHFLYVMQYNRLNDVRDFKISTPCVCVCLWQNKHVGLGLKYVPLE